MKLTRIKIAGYKSIDEAEFTIQKYNNSYTSIFIGKNETGKSNVLDAMGALKQLVDEEKVTFLGVRNQSQEPSIVSVFYSMTEDDPTRYRAKISESISLPELLIDKITVTSSVKEVWLQKEDSAFNYEWDIKINQFGLAGYLYKEEKTNQSVAVVGVGTQQKITKKNVIAKKSDIPVDNLQTYTELTWEQFEEIIKPFLIEHFENNSIEVSVWKASKEYLISQKISLKEFAKKPSTYPPLRNVFLLAGYKDANDIANKISEIEQSSNYLHKLEKELKKTATDYINKSWSEHQINVEVSISEELNIEFKIQDKDNDGDYYGMTDRSQGFQHFVSLLLSLSIENDTDSMENQLILIDEPEVHLHPSGARYMLKELLKIGRNNYVFFATHSNFMLDSSTRERHYLLTKKEGQTNIKSIKSEEDLMDDEILKSAFGINTINDFLSPKKLFVEGSTDKVLLQKVLPKIDQNHGISIGNGKGNNLKAETSLASFQKIYPLVMVDDDDGGIKMKTQILKDIGYRDKVFTIRDINANIKTNGTIEDALPKEYVLSQTNNVLKKHNISELQSLDENTPFCNQMIAHIGNHLDNKNEELSKKSRKQMIGQILDDIKTEISEKYSEKNIKEKAPLLYELAKKLLLKFK
jgi:predicted ATP-dependent endonuclease of OLD family